MGASPERRDAGSLSDAADQPGIQGEPGRSQLPALDQQETLISWLNAHSDALVGAVNPNGEPVAMPASMPIGREHRTDSRSLLDLVIPEDSRAVTDAFVAALARGVGIAKIHLSSDPDQPHLLQYLDLRDRYGVILRMVVRGDDLGDEKGARIGPEVLTATGRACA